MLIDTYKDNPSLRPTMLIHEIMKTVYRPALRTLPTNRPDTTDSVARETPRAA